MSTNSLIGGIVGGVAGFFIGGPAGAAVGFGIGAGLGGMLTPIDMPGQQGPRLSDLKVQTSTYGAAIPRVYGTVGITGNVFWLEGNQLKEVVTRKKVKAGGKGGSKKTTVTTYTYYATLAIGLCEGPIAGVRRIWAGPNLIYDAASEDVETIIASNLNAAGFAIYHGAADQQPDSRIQADRGAANTPAYRGLAYVVIKDFLLTDYGNAIPAFKVEVVDSDGASTPTLVGTASIQGVPAFASGGTIETVEPMSGGFGVDYHGSIAVRRYQLATGALLSYSLRSESIAIGGGSVNPLYYGSREVAGSPGMAFVYRTVGGGMVKFYGADNALSLDDITGQGESCFAGEFYWIGGATKIHKIDQDFSLVDSYVIPSDIGASRIRIRHDESTGRYFIKYIRAETAEIIFGEFSNDPLDMLWSVSLGYSSIYADGDIDSFVVGDGMAAFGLEGGLRVYRIDGQGVSLAGDSENFGGLRKPVYSAGPAVAICSGRVYKYTDSVSATSSSMSSIIGSEVSLCGLDPVYEVDAAGVHGDVSGFMVASVGSIRSALETLRAAFPFDAYQSGYGIAFRPRGGVSVATIAIAELGVDEQLPQAREMDGQLPAKLAVRYLDAARNYDGNEQFAERINTDAVNDTSLELAIVMTANQAAQVAERLLAVAWLERVSFGPFQLPPEYRHLEPSDVITIDAGYASYELRLTEVSYNADGSLTCSGLPNSSAVYVSTATSDETPSEQVIGLGGDSLFVPIDIPVIDETIQDSPGFVGAMTGYTTGWPGAVAVQSFDGGQTWAEIQAFNGKASIGYAQGMLSANDGALIDESGLAVTLISGELESVTEAQMLSGTNWAAYGADGRWEIVRFRDAAQQIDGSYLVSGFKRGERGTEWATGLHQVGDLFVALDDGDLALIGLAVDSISVASTWRGVTAGDSVDAASDVPFTYRGVNLRPLSPVYPVASRNGSGDLSLAWTRRSRLSSSWWATGTAAPLGEAGESYEVDILNGSDVVRTIASSSPSISYTVAQQTADFGATQASITVRIYQLSAVVGRGYALEVTA